MAPQGAFSTSLGSIAVTDFRNYRESRLEVDSKSVLLLGENGAGKTNLMEAISLLAPGRGLRRARPEDLPRSGSENAVWAVAAQASARGQSLAIGTGVMAGQAAPGRVMRLDGETVPQTQIGRLFSASWITPRMDGIFVEGPSARRRFLDRLVIAFDPAHIGRGTRYEKMFRERNHLLVEGRGDAAWFAAIEEGLAASAVAVTAARQALVDDINAEAGEGWCGFPGVRLALQGELEGWLEGMPALEAERRFAEAARTRRARGEPGLPGPHASELVAFDTASGTPARLASTGQQKALAVAVILGHARLQAARLGRAPVMLLDDVVASLDAPRRARLFDAVALLGGQAWFSGTDMDDFAGLDAQLVRVVASSGAAQLMV